MWCPECDKPTQVLDTRKYRDITGSFDFARRRRVCRDCGYKFLSIEVPQEEWNKYYAPSENYEEEQDEDS